MSLASNKSQRTYHKNNKESVLKNYKVWKDNNLEKVLGYDQKKRKNMKEREVCSILQKHHTILINDPNRLSTEFMLKIIKGMI